jgi:hypothetical protein
MSEGDPRGPREPDRLTPEQEERLADYLSGGMPATERLRFEQEALADDGLSAALYREVSLDASIAAASASAEALAPTSPRDPLRWFRLRWAIPAAAVAVVLAGFFLIRDPGRIPPAGEPQPPTFRGEASLLEPVAPVGTVGTTPSLFHWRRVPGAVLYRFDLFDETMQRIHQAAVAETILAAGSHGLSTPPASGAWKVTALGADGATIAESPITAYDSRY